MLMLRAFVRDGVAAAARPADLDRRRPPRRAVLLPPVPRRAADRRRFAARGGHAHRAGRDRRRARHVVAGTRHRRTGRRPRRRARDGRLRVGRGRVHVHLEPEPHRPVERDRAGRGVARVDDPAILAGGCSPRSARRSRCNATCWASRSCRSSAASSSPTRGAGGPGSERRRVWRFGLAGLGIVALSFLPLVVHELTSDFSEIGAALDYLRAGGDATAIGPIGRFLIIGVRVVSWPLSGLADRCPDRRPDRDGRGHRHRRVVRRARARPGNDRRPDGSGSACSGRPGS